MCRDPLYVLTVHDWELFYILICFELSSIISLSTPETSNQFAQFNSTWPSSRNLVILQRIAIALQKFYIYIFFNSKFPLPWLQEPSFFRGSRLKFYTHLCFYSSHCALHQSRSPSLIKYVTHFVEQNLWIFSLSSFSRFLFLLHSCI